MEKVAAARAMEWSIELEKGLRSKRPGQPIEVIEQVGSKLLKWSRESCICMSASKMYGLVPGEERSFANTILIRLAHAFSSGDNRMRACILKVFLLELRHIKEKGRSYDGILAKKRLPNYLELLKIVRFVFNTGDVKARTLSLRLLGCWAPLTHDNADMRHIVLLSLRSDNISEVKASLFASGCLSRHSDDFACIVVGILVDIMCSVNASSSVKLAAIRALGEVQCSCLAASRAYKSGKKMVLRSQLEDDTVEMLSSLSKLALKSVILIPEQVDILLSFLAQECSPVIKSMALKCIRFMYVHGFCYFPVSGNVFSALFHKIDDPALSLDLQCDVLKTLHQLFSGSRKVCYMDIPEFPSLIMIVEHASQSSYISKRYLALGLLVDISCNAKMARKGNCSWTEQLSIECASFQSQACSADLFSVINDAVLLARHVILILIDHVTSMMKNVGIEIDKGTIFLEDAGPKNAACEIKQKCRVLFKHIMRLIGEYPVLGLMVLSRFKSLIEDLVDFHHMFTREAPRICCDVSEMETEVNKPNPFFSKCDRGKHAQYVSEIILCICSFVIPCLKVVDENGLAGDEVRRIVKLLVDFLQKVEFCNSNACEMVSFHLCSYITFCCCDTEDTSMQMLDESKVGVNPNLSKDCWVDHERLALGLAKRMMNHRKYWMVYRTGIYSSSEGLWFTAAFAFRKLMDEVKSNSCSDWLKSLMLFAGAESEIKLLLFPKLGIKLISELLSDGQPGKSCEGVKEERMGCDGALAFMHGQKEKLYRIQRRICSSKETLLAVGNMKGAFLFQYWFLNLRGKLLEILLNVLGHLDSHSCREKNLDNYGNGKQNLTNFSSLSAQDVNILTSHFSCISFRLNKLAREYDFLTISFMDMDFKSSRIISRLALYCSLLAFCAGFPLYLTGLRGHENMPSNLGCYDISSSLLLEDLAGRLFNMYGEVAMELDRYMPFCGLLRGGSQTRKQPSKFNHADRGIMLISRFAVSGFHRLQEEAKEAKQEEDIRNVFHKGLQLFCDILVKWMSSPFLTPKYFFRVRYSIGAELFVVNADVGNPGELCVLAGNHLCLSLCIQLRNISPEYFGRASKIYCILAAKSSRPLPGGKNDREREVFTGFQAWKTEEIVDLNELLLSYMENETRRSYKMQGVHINEVNLATSYVCIEPNKQGQGFSTCLFDVSAFPEGAYEIKWHSCFVDKNDSHWSLPALNDAIVFTVKRPSAQVLVQL